MKTSRRSFLGFMAVAPVTAKAAVEAPATIVDPKIEITYVGHRSAFNGLSQLRDLQAEYNRYRSQMIDIVSQRSKMIGAEDE